MKLSHFFLVFFLTFSITISAQDSWTDHFGQSKEDIINSLSFDDKYKKVTTGNFYQIIYRINGGTEEETILLFQFSNPEAKCISVGIALSVKRLQDMIKLLKSRYPNSNLEQTEFWSEREVAKINIQDKQFYISYVPNKR